MFEANLDKEFMYYKQGKHNHNAIIKIQNLDTGDIYKTITLNGFFYFLNLPKGFYKVIEFDIQKQTSSDKFNINYKVNTVEPLMLENNTITISDNLFLDMKNTGAAFSEAFSFNFYTVPAQKDVLKNIFKYMDKKKYWSDFIIQ